MTAELQMTEQTAQALIQILTLNKNTGAALEKLLKLPLLDADNKIPAGALRIAGALSQGYIIESGDNANGYYVRFADGTQWCWQIGLVSTSGSGTNRQVEWSFPAQFLNNSLFIGGTAQATSAGKGLFPFQYTCDSTGTTISFGNDSATGSQPVTVCCIAIGKWK